MCEVFINYRTAVCSECGETFQIEDCKQYAYKTKEKQFCSYNCYNRHLLRIEARFMRKHGHEFLKQKI